MSLVNKTKPLPHKYRIPYLFLGKGKISVNGYFLLFIDKDGSAQIPIEKYSSLMLEPGISISHEAVKLCSTLNVMLFWVGECGVRIYATSYIRTSTESSRQLKQLMLWKESKLRLSAASRLYELMFPDEDNFNYNSIEKYRGAEGAKVRCLYQKIAKDNGVVWKGKDSKTNLNIAINMANSCLYSICELAIVLSGFTPSIGVVHEGKPNSLAYDLADTVKFSEIIPVAFKAYNAEPESVNIIFKVRRDVRDYCHKQKLIDKLIKNIIYIIGG